MDGKNGDAGFRPALRLIGHNDIDLGLTDQIPNEVLTNVGWTQQHPPRHTIDFNHRKRGQQLSRYGQ